MWYAVIVLLATSAHPQPTNIGFLGLPFHTKAACEKIGKDLVNPQFVSISCHKRLSFQAERKDDIPTDR